ncbi:MAG: cytochrome c oxidase subunit 3, partial [Thermoanaerobaculia bacterium]
ADGHCSRRFTPRNGRMAVANDSYVPAADAVHMSSAAFPDLVRSGAPQSLPVRLTGSRSPAWWGTVCLCATEAMLFASFLGSYFFLRGSIVAFGAEGGKYVPLTRPLILTAVLLSSSVTAWWAETGIKGGNASRLKIGLALTFILGVVFLAIQGNEYANRDTSWTTSAYDSLFITITGFHGAHVAFGLLMNLYVQIRAWLGHFDAERHDAVSNSIVYWHFVDGVWLFILAALYLSPRLF